MLLNKHWLKKRKKDKLSCLTTINQPCVDSTIFCKIFEIRILLFFNWSIGNLSQLAITEILESIYYACILAWLVKLMRVWGSGGKPLVILPTLSEPQVVTH